MLCFALRTHAAASPYVLSLWEKVDFIEANAEKEQHK